MNTALLTAVAPFVRCAHPGCDRTLVAAEAIPVTGNAGGFIVRVSCQAGHMTDCKCSVARGQATEHIEPRQPSVRAKLSGVTFQNEGGVERQALLAHVKPGDTLTLFDGELNGFKAIYARHALGVIGSIKRQAIAPLLSDHDLGSLTAKVTQVTGGTEEKTSRGCNVEISLAVEPAQTVYVDPDGRNIYHTDARCSGLQGADAVSIDFAEGILHARPCKKCASPKN